MRPASCRSKIPYDEAKAEQRAAHVMQRAQVLTRAYDCPHCDWWHLTTPKVGGKRIPFVNTSKEKQ